MSTVPHSGVGCGSESLGAEVERGGGGVRVRGVGVGVSGQRIAVLSCRKRGVASPISLTHVNNCRPRRVTSDPRPCLVSHSDHRHSGLTSTHMVTKALSFLRPLRQAPDRGAIWRLRILIH